MGAESRGRTESTLQICGPGVTADDVRVRMAEAAGNKFTVALTQSAFDDLVAELGDRQKVAEFLRGVATENEWPVIVSMGGRSACIPPADWSEQRTKDFVEGVRESLAQEFGEVSAVTHQDLQP